MSVGVGAARGGVGGGWEGRREGEVNKWRTLSTPMAGREGNGEEESQGRWELGRQRGL